MDDGADGPAGDAVAGAAAGGVADGSCGGSGWRSRDGLTQRGGGASAGVSEAGRRPVVSGGWRDANVSRSPRCRGGTCRLPSGRRSRCLRAQGAGVREIARRVGRSPSTISQGAAPQRGHARRAARLPRVGGAVACRAAAPGARRPRSSRPTSGCASMCRSGCPARSAGRTGPRCRARDAAVERPATSRAARTAGGRARGARSRSLPGCASTSPMMSRCGSRTRRSTSRSTCRAAARCARELTACLRTGRALRVPRARVAQRGKSFVTDEVMISERPAEADDRAVPGHWEGDLILGPGQLGDRHAGGAHQPVHDAAAPPADAAAATAAGSRTGRRSPGTAPRRSATRSPPRSATLPEQLRRSLTWDQGAEMAQHAQLRIDTGLHGLLLRSAEPVAARHQREHQRAAAPVLPQGHRPRPPQRRRPRRRRRRAQRPAAQDARLAHPGRGPQRAPRAATA